MEGQILGAGEVGARSPRPQPSTVNIVNILFPISLYKNFKSKIGQS